MVWRWPFQVWVGCAIAAGLAAAELASPARVAAQTDLDAFMRQVLATRDENWKKLQQYVLDERETIDLRGPGRAPIWGERREYTWFIRDGFFVRSPIKINGVTISEGDRRKYEADYLRRQQARERRWAANNHTAEPPPPEAAPAGAPPSDASPPDAAAGDTPPSDVEGLLRQSREPQFVSSAYFLRFRFEEGKYALVAHEQLDVPGLSGSAPAEVLRIEYYPANLFRGTDRRRDGKGTTDEHKAYDAEFRRLMNKTALVTLWVEPKAHQILKYTFDNLTFDFLPAQWLVHVDEAHASMTMGQPFADVWLPNAIEAQAAVTLAAGQFDVHYGVEYHDYRRADVKTKVTIPKGK
jgi:hypothetical protein